MSVLTVGERDGYLEFSREECVAEGRARAGLYRGAKPFPHIAIDDFLDAAFLRGLLPEFPETDGKGFFDRDQERLKFQFTPEEVQGRRLRNLLVELNSPAFLAFLEEMTGIKALIPDPYFAGGGLHETKAGGHLGVHADFNIHGVMRVERRLNLLIYLNDDWPAEYGGDLELWDREMREKRVSVAPLIGRAVVFNTTLESFHGQPDPVRCPPDRARRSIATYYYTAAPEGTEKLPQRTTVFRPRPGTGDKRDLAVGFDHFLKDWVPPRLYRFATKFNRFR